VSDTLDTYLADTYDQLVDSPVLYSWPDTATYMVNGVKVLVHCAHSGSDTVAPAYAKELARLTKTIGKFLPTMPVNHYAFLFYLWRGDRSKVSNPNAMGALEHGNSSFYFLGFQRRPLGLGEVAVHEFFHILVPLNLHSEEIDNFDFRRPKMSQHLWLYEGTTEYFSTLAPLHDSTITEERFRKDIEGKLRGVQQLQPDFSWTEFSKNVLTKEGQELYPIVYTYGAVNAMLVDIVMRAASGGEQGLLKVIYRLMQDYGPSRPFKDDSLFALIGSVTSPDVRTYLEEHVGGTKRPDFEKLFGLIGWTYVPEKTTRVPGYGIRASFVMRDTSASMMLNVADAANPLKVKDGDEVIKVNGMTLEELFSSANGRTAMKTLRDPKLDDELTLVVRRDGQEISLTGKAVMVNRVERHFLTIDPDPTEEQKKLKQALFYR
jgi:predicted metalloprotease with PDZ domain